MPTPSIRGLRGRNEPASAEQPRREVWDDLVENSTSHRRETEIRKGRPYGRRGPGPTPARNSKRQNATQVEVAAAMGVSQARVSRIEKGQLEERGRDWPPT